MAGLSCDLYCGELDLLAQLVGELNECGNVLGDDLVVDMELIIKEQDHSMGEVQRAAYSHQVSVELLGVGIRIDAQLSEPDRSQCR